MGSWNADMSRPWTAADNQTTNSGFPFTLTWHTWTAYNMPATGLCNPELTYPIIMLGCNVSPSPTDVSPTENSWMLQPLDKVSLGYFAPDRTIPSLNSDLIERSDTRLPTVARFSAAKGWSSMCGLSVHKTEGRQPNKPGQGRRRSLPDAPLIH